MVQRVAEADHGQRFLDPRPDLLCRETNVLKAKRDLVPQPSHHPLCFRVLLDEADMPAHHRGRCRHARDGEGTFAFALVHPQNPGDPVQQSGLTRPRVTNNEDAFLRRDFQRHVPHRPRLTPRVTPTPPLQTNWGCDEVRDRILWEWGSHL